MEKKSYLNLLKWFLKLAISSLAIYYVFSKIDFDDVVIRFKDANWLFMFFALLLFVLSKLISTYRLQLFFKKIDINISDKYNIKLYLLGMFYNLGLPGGIGGDGYKAYLLKKQFPSIKTKNIVAAAFMDRFAGMAVLCSLIVVFMSFVPTEYYIIKYVWILVIPGITLFYLVFHWFFKSFKSLFYKVNYYSMLVQICQIACSVCILYALGLYNQWNPYVVLFLISSVAAIAPVTIGGIGLREAVLLKGAVFLNLDAGLAVSLGMGFYLVTALTSLCGAYYAFGKNALIKRGENHDTNQQIG